MLRRQALRVAKDLRHACWSSRTAVYCPWWWLCRPSWWSSFCPSSSQWWWSQKRFLSTMWWANASLICFCFLRSWDGKLVSSKSLHLFTSSVHAWFFLLQFCIMFSIQVSYRSIGVLIQGYAVDYSLHMVTLSAQLRKQCHHISMFGKWMLGIRLSFSPEPLNHCPSTITAWMFWFSFDIVVSTLSLLCEDIPTKPQSLHWWRRICSIWWQILVTCISQDENFEEHCIVAVQRSKNMAATMHLLRMIL